MTRSELVDASVKVILETLGRHLAAGNRVELRRFGNFKHANHIKSAIPEQGRWRYPRKAVHSV